MKRNFAIGVVIFILAGGVISLTFSKTNSTGSPSLSLASKKHVLAAINTNTASQDSNPPTIFRDASGTVLSIQLSSTQPDYGQFSFYVPQIGYYNGIIPLQQSGQRIIHPQGSTPATFYPVTGNTTASTTVRMEGEINIEHNTASINIWINGTHYHVEVAQVDTNAVAATIKQVFNDFTSQNWQSLYNSLSLETQSTIAQAQFIQLLNTNLPKVLTIDFNGAGQVTSAAGYSYYAQPVALTMQKPDGTTTSNQSIFYFILEQGAWKLLTTDTPVSL